MNLALWEAQIIQSISLEAETKGTWEKKQGEEEEEFPSGGRGQGLITCPQASRDQILLPSKTLGKWQKPRKEQEISFLLVPKHEMEEIPLVQPNPDRLVADESHTMAR